MKTLGILVAIITCSLIAAGAEDDLPAGDKAAALRAMLRVSIMQSAIAQADAEHLAEQAKRREQLRQAGESYQRLMEKLREEHGKPSGCVLNTDAEWQCPEVTNEETTPTPDSQ